jgi:hypothetical protein
VYAAAIAIPPAASQYLTAISAAAPEVPAAAPEVSPKPAPKAAPEAPPAASKITIAMDF